MLIYCMYVISSINNGCKKNIEGVCIDSGGSRTLFQRGRLFKKIYNNNNNYT